MMSMAQEAINGAGQVRYTYSAILATAMDVSRGTTAGTLAHAMRNWSVAGIRGALRALPVNGAALAIPTSRVAVLETLARAISDLRAYGFVATAAV